QTAGRRDADRRGDRARESNNGSKIGRQKTTPPRRGRISQKIAAGRVPRRSRLHASFSLTRGLRRSRSWKRPSAASDPRQTTATPLFSRSLGMGTCTSISRTSTGRGAYVDGPVQRAWQADSSPIVGSVIYSRAG